MENNDEEEEEDDDDDEDDEDDDDDDEPPPRIRHMCIKTQERYILVMEFNHGSRYSIM